MTSVSVALLLLPRSGFAQEASGRGLTVDADLMTRGELRIGGLASEDEDALTKRAAFLLERTRVGLDYVQPGLETKVTAQHSGTWGGAGGGSIGVYEAWVKMDLPKGFFAKVGRQNLSYDDQRIFGADDWSMTGLSHDLLKVGYEGNGHKVHLFGAYNQNPSNITSGSSYYVDGFQPYKAMEALWYHADIPSWHLGVSALFLNVGMQGTLVTEEEEKKEVVYQQQITGGYLTFRPGIWSVEASGYYQFGHHDEGLPLRAWMASGKVSATPSKAWQLSGGYDYLSGDKNFATPAEGDIGLTRHEVIRGFSSIYGSHHKFYGAMDFFYITTYVGGFTPGLQNAYVSGSWTPQPGISVDASYHFLATAAKLEDMNRPLGHEIELSAAWTFVPDATLSLGYSYMHGTETMERLKRVSGTHNLHWAWIMLVVKPRLFDSRRP